MNQFTHENPNVAAVVNAAMKQGVWNGRTLDKGTLGIFKIDQVHVVALFDGGSSPLEVYLSRDLEVRVLDRIGAAHSKDLVHEVQFEVPQKAAYVG